ncbi:MAG: dTMP kinase [Acidimicrobiales bacterium]|nr:dTMP kinase [Acidimicrobiales bacterium]
MSGRLIVFEGADASGKSTQARRLAERLGADLTFQFGATAIGADIRSILLDPVHSELDARAEALLVIADKAQHVAEIVGPALERGGTVVSDRFTASTSAYQGYGRGLDLAGLDAMMRFATRGIEPDLTVLLDVPWSVARIRLGDQMDRIEGAGADFHTRVRDGYLAMAAADPGRWVVVDADGTVDEIAERVDAAVDDWLAENG